MHPQIVQSEPGTCPIRKIALRPHFLFQDELSKFSCQGPGESESGPLDVYTDVLEHFEKVLKRASQIRLRDVLNAKDLHYWPRIYTAFEVFARETAWFESELKRQRFGLTDLILCEIM